MNGSSVRNMYTNYASIIRNVKSQYIDVVIMLQV